MCSWNRLGVGGNFPLLRVDTKGISEYPRMTVLSSHGRSYNECELCLDTSQLKIGILLDVCFHCNEVMP